MNICPSSFARYPVNARSVPKAISSTLFCCPQSTAASATLRFNFLFPLFSLFFFWPVASSTRLLRAAALIKAARLSFLSFYLLLFVVLPFPDVLSSLLRALYNNYLPGFVNISCYRTWLRFDRPSPSIFYDSIIRATP